MVGKYEESVLHTFDAIDGLLRSTGYPPRIDGEHATVDSDLAPHCDTATDEIRPCPIRLLRGADAPLEFIAHATMSVAP
jgi:hypothetical protein